MNAIIKAKTTNNNGNVDVLCFRFPSKCLEDEDLFKFSLALESVRSVLEYRGV